ncbi:MAG TPA: hypothetical protein VF316_04970 [Polyangiaceae bacterium]
MQKWLLLFGLVVAPGACSVMLVDAPVSVHAIFVTPASLDQLSGEAFLDHPFPSDVRREPDGKVRFQGFYNPTENVLIDSFVKAATGLLDGFSPSASGYFRFDGDLDPATLPQDPPASLDPTSSLQLIDIDPTSPEHGQRKLTSWFFRPKPGVFWLADTLAVSPSHGWPLRSKTRYAIVLTRDARAVGGNPILPSADLEEVLGLRPTTDRTAQVRAIYTPALDELSKAGIDARKIAHLTVFTTNDPTDELFRVTDAAKTLEAPKADDQAWAAKEQSSSYDVYEGVYGPVPNYQAGKLPFAQADDGGGFLFDKDGKPVVQNTFTMRFALAVPNATACPMPADGYPIVLYAHGTGGDYRSFLSSSGEPGQLLPKVCIAVMGVDQIFHGIRPGAPPLDDPNRIGEIELLYFNFGNPIAFRTNVRQSSVDVTMQARLFSDSKMVVPAAVSRTTADIHFDASRLMFYGHSQGGQNGPLFLGSDDVARGGVLSGSGAMIIVPLLEKTKPSPSVVGAVKTLMGLNGEGNEDELNFFHPVLNLAQTLGDVGDPLNYVPYIIKSPRHGVHKSIYMTEGIAADGTGDNYAPPDGIEIASVSMGLPRMLPGVRPVEMAAWGGLGDVTIPPEGLSGNLGGGTATGILAQFPPVDGSDGHFVIFDVLAARRQSTQFMKNLAADPKGRVPPLD